MKNLMIPSWAATAAAVLAVGTLVQSPSPKMLENLMKMKLDEMRKEMLQHQLVVLQRLLVDVEEAGGIGEAGVGGERLRGAHGGSHVQQVVGHGHLMVVLTTTGSLGSCFTVSCVSRCWKTASLVSGLTSIKLCLRFTLMPLI